MLTVPKIVMYPHYRIRVPRVAHLSTSCGSGDLREAAAPAAAATDATGVFAAELVPEVWLAQVCLQRRNKDVACAIWSVSGRPFAGPHDLADSRSRVRSTRRASMATSDDMSVRSGGQRPTPCPKWSRSVQSQRAQWLTTNQGTRLLHQYLSPWTKKFETVRGDDGRRAGGGVGWGHVDFFPRFSSKSQRL